MESPANPSCPQGTAGKHPSWGLATEPTNAPLCPIWFGLFLSLVTKGAVILTVRHMCQPLRPLLTVTLMTDCSHVAACPLADLLPSPVRTLRRSSGNQAEEITKGIRGMASLCSSCGVPRSEEMVPW